jgi:hypothetical protein
VPPFKGLPPFLLRARERGSTAGTGTPSPIESALVSRVPMGPPRICFWFYGWLPKARGMNPEPRVEPRKEVPVWLLSTYIQATPVGEIAGPEPN